MGSALGRRAPVRRKKTVLLPRGDQQRCPCAPATDKVTEESGERAGSGTPRRRNGAGLFVSGKTYCGREDSLSLFYVMKRPTHKEKVRIVSQL